MQPTGEGPLRVGVNGDAKQHDGTIDDNLLIYQLIRSFGKEISYSQIWARKENRPHPTMLRHPRSILRR